MLCISQVGGDEVSIGLCSLKGGVDAILPKEFGMVGACSLPVDEHGVGGSLHPSSQHSVIRYRNGSWHIGRDRQVHYQDLGHAHKWLHHLIKLLVGERAIVAYVDHHSISEMVGGTQLPEGIDSSWRLTTALCIEQTETRYLLLQRVDCP